MTLFGIQWTDPLTYFGNTFIGPFTVQSSIIAGLAFAACAVFVRYYYKNFYESAEAPKGWRTFFIGLVLMALYQFLKVPFTYEWIYGDLAILVFLVYQLVAISWLVWGVYLLKREVE
ncbi:MAG TPA: hypothetical protein VJH90_02120 [archaeon]|nr:hypothetical protein [archaeon]